MRAPTSEQHEQSRGDAQAIDMMPEIVLVYAPMRRASSASRVSPGKRQIGRRGESS